MERILVSACLLGQRVRYDGGGFDPLQQLLEWQAQGRLVVVCPEVAGGLPTPRPPAEIPGGQGAEVLAGRLPVHTDQGERQVTIVKVGRFMADVDTNHPFAGKTLHFDVEILDVRAATAEELDHGHAHGVGGHQH